MKSAVVVAGLVALGNAAYIFDVTQCNTNLDDVRNWASNTNVFSDPPNRVKFGGAGQPWREIEVMVPTGSFSMKGIELRGDMTLNFMDSGSELTFDRNANAPDARFTAGQTERPECDLGCHQNYKMGSVADARDTRISSLLPNLQDAENMPCSNDHVIIPYGYNTLMYAWGDFTFRKFTKVMPDRSVVDVTSRSNLPSRTFYPPIPVVRFGDDAMSFCERAGRLDRTGSECICTTRCVAELGATSDQGSALLQGIFSESDSIRTEAIRQASTRSDRLGRNQMRFSFEYTYRNVFGSGAIDASSGAACLARSNMAALLNETIGDYVQVLSASASVQGTSLIVRGTVLGPDTAAYSIRGWRRTGSFAPFQANPFPRNGATAAEAAFRAVSQAFTTCGGVTGFVSAVFLQHGEQQTFDIYVGSNMAQADLGYYLRDNVRAQYGQMLANGLENFYGIYGIDLNVLMSNLELLSPDQIWHAQYGNGASSSTGTVPINYGMATHLIRVRLQFRTFTPVTVDSNRAVALTLRADMLTANFFASVVPDRPCSLTAANGVYLCLRNRVDAARDQFCITQGGSGANPCSVMNRQDDATRMRQQTTEAAANEMRAQYAGDGMVNGAFCGPLGMHNGACVDPEWNAIQTQSTAALASESYNDWYGDEMTQASASSSDSNDSAGMMLYIVVAAAALLIIIVLIATRRKGAGGEREPKMTSDVMAFENPIYDTEEQVTNTANTAPAAAPAPAAPAAPAEDMYDEPAMVAGSAADPNAGGYLDVEPEDDEDSDEDE